MLGQRRRRWLNIETALFERLVFAGCCFVDRTAHTHNEDDVLTVHHHDRLRNTQGLKCDVCTPLVSHCKFSPNEEHLAKELSWTIFNKVHAIKKNIRT